MLISKIKSLKSLLTEDIETMIQQQPVSQEEVPVVDVSLDQKVDHFLIQYERESLPMSAQQTPPTGNPSAPVVQQEHRKAKKKSLKEDFSNKRLLNFLFEAPEDELQTDDAPAPDASPDASSAMPDLGGGTDPTAGGAPEKGPAPVPTPQINIQNFAKNVARLINNYQALIDPKRVILNRTKSYIDKNYNAQVSQQLMDILDTDYNISPESISQKYDEKSPITPMVGALDSVENQPTPSATVAPTP